MAAAAASVGTGQAAPVILFGACDRHNLGDLLFPHMAAALLPGRDLLVAGLADRDLRPFGGHRVQALHRLAGDPRLRGAQLVHVGGEILSCSARQAAVMLQPGDDWALTLSYIEHHADEEPVWLQATLGTVVPMPYVVSRQQLPAVDRVVFDAVGGVALAALPPPWRQAVLARLAAADAVSVRDAVTWNRLRTAGIAATLMPDPAVMVEALFGAAIRARAARPPVADLLAAFPGGYIALQLAADFADDATLDAVAAQVAAALAGTLLGVVLFRAGAAPWHDDLGMLARLAVRLASRQAPSAVRLFESLDIWDLGALLAHARLQVGSSLHGHIVATAFGVPAVGLQRPDEAGRVGKLATYLATWAAGSGEEEVAGVTPITRLAVTIRGALAAKAAPRHAQSLRCVQAYRAGFERLARCLR